MRKLLLILFILLSVSTYACECALGTSLEEHIEDADIIFYGTVVSINDAKYEEYKDMLKYYLDQENYPEKYGYKPSFKILEIFKGKFPNPTEDNIFEYKSYWSNCDRIFKKGFSYIFFGHIDDNGEINTNICTIGGVVKDLEYLEKLRSKITPATNKD